MNVGTPKKNPAISGPIITLPSTAGLNITS